MTRSEPPQSTKTFAIRIPALVVRTSAGASRRDAARYSTSGSKGTRLFATEDGNPLSPMDSVGPTPSITVAGLWNRLDRLQGPRTVRTMAGPPAITRPSRAEAALCERVPVTAAYTFSKASTTPAKSLQFGGTVELAEQFGSIVFGGCRSTAASASRPAAAAGFQLRLRSCVHEIAARLLATAAGGWQLSGLTTLLKRRALLVSTAPTPTASPVPLTTGRFQSAGRAGVRPCRAPPRRPAYVKPDDGKQADRSGSGALHRYRHHTTTHRTPPGIWAATPSGPGLKNWDVTSSRPPRSTSASRWSSGPSSTTSGTLDVRPR